jgi:hypothetical protein
MTDNEIKLKDLEERVKKLENVVFDQWLMQYEPEWDISEEPPPLPPVAACSNEQLYEANRKWNEWYEKHPWKI